MWMELNYYTPGEHGKRYIVINYMNEWMSEWMNEHAVI